MLAVFWLCLVLILGTGFVLARSRAAFERARDRLAEGQDEKAFAEFEDAARWYFPGNPYTRAALARMRFMAREHELAGRTAEALESYRAVARSVMAVRHVWTPFTDLLHEAEASEKRLARALPTPPDQPLTADSGAGQTSLPVYRDPGLLGTAMLVLGFLIWLLASAWWLVGPPSWPAFDRRWGTLAMLGGLLLWLAGIWIA